MSKDDGVIRINTITVHALDDGLISFLHATGNSGRYDFSIFGSDQRLNIQGRSDCAASRGKPTTFDKVGNIIDNSREYQTMLDFIEFLRNIGSAAFFHRSRSEQAMRTSAPRAKVT